jgi:sugar phosphate isomerase/epimerase
VIDPGRLSLNLMTVDHWSLAEAAERCAAAGIDWVAPWRHQYEDAAAAARTIAAAGLQVSSLCRGGFFTTPGADADNRRAVEEAAALGAPVLVLVCGPPRDRNLLAAQMEIRRGIERLLPFAAERGVRLGIEPLHPMMIGERSALITVAQAFDIVRNLDFHPAVGVVIDDYHVFWDPDLGIELDGAHDMVAGFHVSDWLVPTTDLLAGRGLMGDGIIDLPRIRGLVEATGYDGPVEVEVINPALAEHADLLADIKARCARI